MRKMGEAVRKCVIVGNSSTRMTWEDLGLIGLSCQPL